MTTRIPQADYVAPIFERAELYMREHPEKFGRVEEKAAILFWQNMKEKKLDSVSRDG